MPASFQRCTEHGDPLERSAHRPRARAARRPATASMAERAQPCCDRCGESAHKMMKCGRCKSAQYCSKEVVCLSCAPAAAARRAACGRAAESRATKKNAPPAGLRAATPVCAPRAKASAGPAGPRGRSAPHARHDCARCSSRTAHAPPVPKGCVVAAQGGVYEAAEARFRNRGPVLYAPSTRH